MQLLHITRAHTHVRPRSHAHPHTHTLARSRMYIYIYIYIYIYHLVFVIFINFYLVLISDFVTFHFCSLFIYFDFETIFLLYQVINKEIIIIIIIIKAQTQEYT